MCDWGVNISLLHVYVHVKIEKGGQFITKCDVKRRLNPPKTNLLSFPRGAIDAVVQKRDFERVMDIIMYFSVICEIFAGPPPRKRYIQWCRIGSAIVDELVSWVKGEGEGIIRWMKGNRCKGGVKIIETEHFGENRSGRGGIILFSQFPLYPDIL